MPLDRTSPAFWKNLVPKKTTIVFKDEASLTEDMEGLTYEVVRRRSMPEQNGLFEYVLLELEGQGIKLGDECWLVVKIVDETIGFIRVREPEEYNPGNRFDMVIEERGRWLFCPPEDIEPEDGCEIDLEEDEDDDEDGIVLNDLKYTDEFEWGDRTYIRKAQGDVDCTPIRDEPAASGIDPNRQLATVAEYADEQRKTSGEPEAIVIEVGDVEDPNGGLITLLMGQDLQMSDIEVLVE